MSDNSTKEKITEQFKKLDKNNTGHLEINEVKEALKQIYTSIDIRLTDADLAKMIQSVDKNGDGKININEFVQL
ncbi:unnamed protein product, partial [Brachionus calyciflorus]